MKKGDGRSEERGGGHGRWVEGGEEEERDKKRERERRERQDGETREK